MDEQIMSSCGTARTGRAASRAGRVRFYFVASHLEFRSQESELISNHLGVALPLFVMFSKPETHKSSGKMT